MSTPQPNKNINIKDSPAVPSRVNIKSKYGSNTNHENQNHPNQPLAKERKVSGTISERTNSPQPQPIERGRRISSDKLAIFGGQAGQGNQQPGLGPRQNSALSKTKSGASSINERISGFERKNSDLGQTLSRSLSRESLLGVVLDK